MHALWKPSATMDNLRQRANLMAKLRQFFQARDYLEVETPIMARFGVTDVYLSNIKASFRKKNYCLQTSPEYHMKRLLAAGSGSIFQIARVFRDDELGRWHNPEFTMLEWYRLDYKAEDLIAEVDALLQTILATKPSEHLTYQKAFTVHCAGIDPFHASIQDLKEALKMHQLEGVLVETEEDRDQYLFLLMSHVVEPAFKAYQRPVVVTHFPPSQASLAAVEQGLALRFEFYYAGVELANGFQELCDPNVQKARFAKEVKERQRMQLEAVEIDTFLIEALAHGLPLCSGVALGVDRLFALAMGYDTIASVLAFDFSRA